MLCAEATEVPHLVYSLLGEADLEPLLRAKYYGIGLFQG